MEEKRTGAPAFTIAKTEPDKMLVFGWGNVAVDADGTQIEDLQGDVIDPEELEKAAYDHVLNFRSTGERHDPGLRRKGRLVESCVFTKEKQAAIGIPPGIVPEGWWVGYKIDDPAAWEKIKNGEYLSFSVEGKGKRTPIEKARVAKSYLDIRKANPYHDKRGRFASKPGGASAQAWQMNRGTLKDIAGMQVVKDIIADNEFAHYGLRIQEKDTEQVGQAMEHRSKNFGGDFDDPENGLDDIAGELDGVTAVGMDRIHEVGEFGGYSGAVAYLLGSNEYPEAGYDPGEAIMQEPTVLAKIGMKDGKLTVLEHVETQGKPADQEKKAPGQRAENPGYTTFMSQMEAKYGRDKLWDAMDDDEFDRAQWWESHRYDSVAKSYAQVRKFNPYHDARGRFSTANGYASFTARTKDPKKQHWADAAVQREKQRQAAAAPPKPVVHRDKNGFADYDAADYHQLYNGKGYYQQQNLSAAAKQELNKYLDPYTEPGSLYNFSQNMNMAAQTGTLNQRPKYQQAYNTIVGSMHNLGYNVNLTRYDHGGFLDERLAGAGIRGGHRGMSVAQLKQALVGQTYGDNRILSTTYNDFKNASNHQTFTTREVKITYRAKASTQALMPGDGPGGRFGEMLLGPTSGSQNQYRIVDVKPTGQKARAKGMPVSSMNLNQIEVVVEVG